MKATLLGNDGESSITIGISINAKDGLTNGEIEFLMAQAIRRIAAVLYDLPHSDFGIDNIKVRRK